MSQFFHGLHTHQTCHPLSMFGMLWIDVYDSVFQFPPISSNFTQTLSRSGTTFHRPQSIAWSTLMWRRCVALNETNGGHNRYWQVFWSTPVPCFLRYLWLTDAYLYSQSCEIHRLEPDKSISIDWFPYMNCNSVKYFKLLHVWFIFLSSIIVMWAESIRVIAGGWVTGRYIASVLFYTTVM
jgi:hypothetical protein